ncbi:MAG: chromate efflux transporter [Geminicoccaceae bacterium]
MSDHDLGLTVGAAKVKDPSFAEALRIWVRIGLLSFGGPTAQIALMHREVVERKGWLGEQTFLNALSFCMLLPGPEAMQLATYTGWRLHGLRGGLAAGLLFVLPGAVLVLILAAIYAAFGEVALVQAVFVGIKSAVLVIVIEALLRVARRALKRRIDWAIAALSFVAIFFLALPFPLVILLAALAGFFAVTGNAAEAPSSVWTNDGASIGPSIDHAMRTALTWLLIWLAPLIGVALVFGGGHVLTELAIFFSKLAVVTFGGAYAVLAYMTQEVVQNHGWLAAGEMLDGLGLAETTNGPLILVTEFGGYIAGYRFGGGPPVFMGLLGAAVTLWATFAPCFLWVFTGAPFIEHLQRMPRLSGALAGVTAAVVGVILNLSVWFGLHVFFGEVDARALGPLTLWLPDLGTIDPLSVALAVIAAVALLRHHLGLAWTLTMTGGLALAWHLVAP